MYESHDNIHSEIYYLDRHEAVKLKLFIVLLSLLLTMGVNEMCTCARLALPVDFVQSQLQLQQMCHSIEHWADEGVENKVFSLRNRIKNKSADDNNSSNNNITR